MLNVLNKKELYEIAESIIPTLKTKFTLDQILNDFTNIYYNLSGDDKRMKIMANTFFTNDDGYVKSKTTQIYRLSSSERKESTKEELYQKFSDIKLFCFCLQQIKDIDALLEKNLKILNQDEINEDAKNEIDKFFEKGKRKKMVF